MSTGICSHQRHSLPSAGNSPCGMLPDASPEHFFLHFRPLTSSHLLSWWEWDLADILAWISNFSSLLLESSLMPVCYHWALVWSDLITSGDRERVINKIGEMLYFCLVYFTQKYFHIGMVATCSYFFGWISSTQLQMYECTILSLEEMPGFKRRMLLREIHGNTAWRGNIHSWWILIWICFIKNVVAIEWLLIFFWEIHNKNSRETFISHMKQLLRKVFPVLF